MTLANIKAHAATLPRAKRIAYLKGALCVNPHNKAGQQIRQLLEHEQQAKQQNRQDNDTRSTQRNQTEPTNPQQSTLF